MVVALFVSLLLALSVSALPTVGVEPQDARPVIHGALPVGSVRPTVPSVAAAANETAQSERHVFKRGKLSDWMCREWWNDGKNCDGSSGKHPEDE
ncbi:hypothetical protein LTR60_006586, partial [Cryomyces antarcticus]